MPWNRSIPHPPWSRPNGRPRSLLERLALHPFRPILPSMNSPSQPRSPPHFAQRDHKRRKWQTRQSWQIATLWSVPSILPTHPASKRTDAIKANDSSRRENSYSFRLTPPHTPPETNSGCFENWHKPQPANDLVGCEMRLNNRLVTKSQGNAMAGTTNVEVGSAMIPRKHRNHLGAPSIWGIIVR